MNRVLHRSTFESSVAFCSLLLSLHAVRRASIVLRTVKQSSRAQVTSEEVKLLDRDRSTSLDLAGKLAPDSMAVQYPSSQAAQLTMDEVEKIRVNYLTIGSY